MSVRLDGRWPTFDHLSRLTDERGLFEHARYDVARREHGYCLDDVARALVVVCREPIVTPELERLCALYLAFTLSAVRADGACHNRMSAEGQWTDQPSFGDWWGRALWGLGVAAVHAPTPPMRAEALAGFHVAAARRSPHLRATVFAALGAGEVALVHHDDAAALGLMHEVIRRVGPPLGYAAWPWPEPRLKYGNGSVVEALLLAGVVAEQPAVAAHGLVLLDFLVRTETSSGRLSVTPVDGRGPADGPSALDQQPIEVAALADACARAYRMTRDPAWLDTVTAAWAWFLGDNDSGMCMYDPLTGGGFDGLEAGGVNLNQGAESTLALLSTAQQARRLLGDQ